MAIIELTLGLFAEVDDEDAEELSKRKWQAYIKFQGKQRSLGYFKTEQEAHMAYMAEARKIHGDWMPLPKDLE